MCHNIPCTSQPVEGYIFCKSCFDTRVLRQQCVASAQCTRKAVRGKKWCYDCFQQHIFNTTYKAVSEDDRSKKMDNIHKSIAKASHYIAEHDCSSRGGCACSICDANWKFIKKVNQLKKHQKMLNEMTF